ncbi:MAG: molybdate ABC transporter substrate-binding protein [Gemmatimonadales bacterium]
MTRRLLMSFLVASMVALVAATRTRATLTVFAAASLTSAFNELADTLRHRQPDLHIDLNFAGSQALALQIEQGAAADVFASADEYWMTVASDSGLIDGEPHVFAHNRLVVIVPDANPGRIHRLQDLARPGVKLVVAGDAVPAGHYARTAITTLAALPGFTKEFATRTLRNIVSNEDNVKGVVAKVQLGEADAGIVYVSDVTPAVARAVIRLELPDEANVLANYPIAIVRRSANPVAARAFVGLVLSPTGQAVLSHQGFGPVRATR